MNIYERFEMLTLEKMAAAKVELPLSDTVSAVDTDADSTNIWGIILCAFALALIFIVGFFAYDNDKKKREKELLTKSHASLKAD